MYIYICIYVYIYVCITSVYIHTNIHVHTCVCSYIYFELRIHSRAQVDRSFHNNITQQYHTTYFYIRVYVIHIYTYIYKCICIYDDAYISIYIYTYLEFGIHSRARVNRSFHSNITPSPYPLIQHTQTAYKTRILKSQIHSIVTLNSTAKNSQKSALYSHL